MSDCEKFELFWLLLPHFLLSIIYTLLFEILITRPNDEFSARTTHQGERDLQVDQPRSEPGPLQVRQPHT